MKKLLITVNGKRYEVDVEVIEDDELIQSQPVFHPPARTIDNHFTPSAPLPPAAPAASAPAPAPAPAAPARAPMPAPRASKLASKPSVSDGASGRGLNSPINGTLLEIRTEVGEEVQENQVLFIVEAMKMKTNIASPVAGCIKSINVRVKDVIEQGQVLLTYE